MAIEPSRQQLFSPEEDFNRLREHEKKQSQLNNPNLFTRLLELGKDKSHDAINWLIDTHKQTKEPKIFMGGLSNEDLNDIIMGSVNPSMGKASAGKKIVDIIKGLIKRGPLKGGQWMLKPPPQKILKGGKTYGHSNVGVSGKYSMQSRTPKFPKDPTYGHSNVGVLEKYSKQWPKLPRPPTPKSPKEELDILLNKLKNNPNVGGNINRIMRENIKKYNP